MLKEILARLQQKHRTIKYPDAPPPEMPERFRGRPCIESSKCNLCKDCVQTCPTDAIEVNENVTIDLGKCLFCTDCADSCPQQAISFTNDYRLSFSKRQDLAVSSDQKEFILAEVLQESIRRLFGRSLKLRQVSAGGCNSCEADVNVLNTVGWDLGRFGIQFVASPRHADGILVTGPVTQNMKLALQKTYQAVPEPKIVIAVGTCAISGGIFAGHRECCDGAGDVIPVDLFIPGCPPHPLTILDGLLRLLGRGELQKSPVL
ncbi:MAG: 4Fe-4S dicluster domain-containing protein [Fibrobacter sp.]|jgi:Ni,Fe-hydrogenase III small subunit/Fe-S-cluster-containing hydrogenase component 2|nr:4Fe-4S dicluster domain-containing protein [Fibrobacter sp.]